MLNKNVSKMIIGIVFVLLALQAIQPAAAKAPDILNNSCEECHLKENGTSTGSIYAMWSASTHALFDVSCEDCHGGDPSNVLKDEAHNGISNQTLLRVNIPGLCGRCHEDQLNEFMSSQHYKRLESALAGPAPSCITCHQAHSVRVLKSSEIQDFCSNCHNNMTGIDPTVPGRAKSALELTKELQIEISIARGDIISAKENGQDVTASEFYQDSAKTILKNSPSVWHRFNLTYFDTEIQKGIENAKKAEKAIPERTAAQTATPKAPGFGVFMLISGLMIAYLIKKN